MVVMISVPADQHLIIGHAGSQIRIASSWMLAVTVRHWPRAGTSARLTVDQWCGSIYIGPQSIKQDGTVGSAQRPLRDTVSQSETCLFAAA